MAKKTAKKTSKRKQEEVVAGVVDSDVEQATDHASGQDQPADNQNGNRGSDTGLAAPETFSIVSGVSSDELQKSLTVVTEQRKIVKEFVQENLVRDTDFGSIHVVGKDRCKNQYNCTVKYHWSKPVLFKPGQEKIFSLFQIRDTIQKDTETYEMLPDIRNLVAFKCTMFNRSGEKIGEGRGSAVVGDKGRDVNATTKIAEKRARMDACLSLGFSEYFTQDLDDPDYKSQREMALERTKQEADARDRDEFGLPVREPEEPVSDLERAYLHKLIVKLGFTSKEEIINLLKANGVADPYNMKSGEAKNLIKKLKATDFLQPEKPESDDDQSDDDGLVIPEKPPAPAQLKIDDELKQYVTEQFDTINFNIRGQYWFMENAAGRPFAKWEQLEQADWRRAYDLINDILNEKVEVEKVYLTTGIGGTPADKTPQQQTLTSEGNQDVESDQAENN